MDHVDIGFTVISQAGRKCPWCERAVELLDTRGLTYSIRPLGRDQLLKEAERASMSTVPIIYHGVKLIGGFTDLEKYLEGEESTCT